MHFAVAKSTKTVHIDHKMSERLRKIISDAVVKDGIRALSERSKISVSAIRRIESGQSPHRTTAYKLALACGVGEEEALALARECTPHEAKKAG